MNAARLSFRAVAHLTKWASLVLRKEPPPDSIDGFWFGLFDVDIGKGVAGCQLYVGGLDPRWSPIRRYPHCRFLKNVYRVIDRVDPESDAADLARWFVPLAFAALAVTHIIRQVPRRLFLGQRRRRGVNVGWDEGDSIRLPDIRRAKTTS